MRIKLLSLVILLLLGTPVLAGIDSTWVETKKHPKLTINKLGGEPLVGKLRALKLDSLLIHSSSGFSGHDLNEITFISVNRSSNKYKGMALGLGFGTGIGLIVGSEARLGRQGIWYKQHWGTTILCAVGGCLSGGIIGALMSGDKKIDFDELPLGEKRNAISQIGGGRWREPTKKEGKEGGKK